MNSPSETNPKSLALWDRVGLLASILCVVHCTMTPVVLFFLPVFGAWFESTWIHILLAAIVYPVGMYAFYTGFSIHRLRHIMWISSAGFLAIAIGLIASDLVTEIVATVLGGICLSVAHILNRKALSNVG